MQDWKRLLLTAAVSAVLITSAITVPLNAQGRGRSDRDRSRALSGKQMPRSYEEPAFARGYAGGYQRGLEDGRRKQRYDPVGSRDYREGDRGYSLSYGSRDAYKTNYRAGCRQGYEDGYRDGTR
jgi:hypothetical protein